MPECKHRPAAAGIWPLPGASLPQAGPHRCRHPDENESNTAQADRPDCHADQIQTPRLQAGWWDGRRRTALLLSGRQHRGRRRRMLPALYIAAGRQPAPAMRGWRHTHPPAPLTPPKVVINPWEVSSTMAMATNAAFSRLELQVSTRARALLATCGGRVTTGKAVPKHRASSAGSVISQSWRDSMAAV